MLTIYTQVRQLPIESAPFMLLLKFSLCCLVLNRVAARILAGFFGGGGYVIVSLFLSEIANDRVRGTLCSSLVLTENIGILMAFILGNYCDFYMIPKFIIALTILFGVLLLFFAESPIFLVKQNRIDVRTEKDINYIINLLKLVSLQEAKKSIRFYQSLREGEKGNKLVNIEIDKLKSTINDGEMQKSDEKSFEWSDFKTKTVRKAMTIGVVLVALNQFSGVVAMLNYTANIFEEAGSNLSPTNQYSYCAKRH